MRTTLTWTRFENFFRLYEDLKDIPNLIYVIGETHHVYIGSVGCRSGARGLANRYQRPYVERSIAIFGSDAPQSQPAFAGRFDDDNATPGTIGDTEALVQWTFLQGKHRDQALFRRRPASRPMLTLDIAGHRRRS